MYGIETVCPEVGAGPKKVGSRLRMVTEVSHAARFPVTHGYVNSRKICETDRFHGYARNRVAGYADP